MGLRPLKLMVESRRANYCAEAGEIGRAIQATLLGYLPVDGNAEAVEQFDVSHEGDVRQAKRAGEVFLAFEFSSVRSNALVIFGFGIVDPLRIAFGFGLADLLDDMNEVKIKVSVAKVFHQARPRPPSESLGMKRRIGIFIFESIH